MAFDSPFSQPKSAFSPEQQRYFEFAEKFFSECIEISKAKNSDYTGDGSNPFANFQSVEQLHITTEQGFLTRMMDKMMRLASFAKKGTLEVKDESVKDTLQDLANYACLFAGYLESKKGCGNMIMGDEDSVKVDDPIKVKDKTHYYDNYLYAVNMIRYSGYSWAKKAIQNMRDQYEERIRNGHYSKPFDFLYDIIAHTFIWEKTPEGSTYWNSIYEELEE